MKMKLSLFSLALLFLISCDKEKNNNEDDHFENGVFILNEGTWMAGNASIDFFEYEEETLAENIFSEENDRPLGDVLNAMTIYDGWGYLVVNNSQKIEVVDPENFASEATVTGLSSPRQFLGISSNKAYVSDLSSGGIYIVDLESFEVTGEIPVVGWVEEMLWVDNDVYAVDAGGANVYQINPGTDEIVDSINVGWSPNSIREDVNGKLWIAAWGTFDGSIAPTLTKINPADNSIEQQWDMTGGLPSELEISDAGDFIYFLNTDVVKMGVNETTIPATPFIVADGRSLYGLGIDHNEGIIYVSDAVDFVQRGTVYRYTTDGDEIDNFLVGIVPADFYFVD